MNRRNALAALSCLPLSAAAAPAWANVRAYGARGDGQTDDSGAFQAALDRAARIWVPPGRYRVGGLVLRSHTRLAGAGASSVLLHAPGTHFLAAVNPGADGSPDPRDNVRDIGLSGLAFVGRGATEGFREHTHLLSVSACSGLQIRGCSFRAFQGDAIYLGSGTQAHVERHNTDIAIRGCRFDGVDYGNRQCVSVIDGTRVAIEGNWMARSSRHDMPGAIDIEPDDPWNVVRDIRIAGNRFVGIQGAVGAVSVILVRSDFTTPPRGIAITGNRIEGAFRTPGLVAKGFVDADRSEPLDLVITGNEILETFHGFEFSGVRGVRFERNLVRHTLVEPVLSLPRRGRSADIRIAGNRFECLATQTGGGLQIHPTARLTMEDNRFRDCLNLPAGKASHAGEGL